MNFTVEDDQRFRPEDYAFAPGHYVLGHGSFGVVYKMRHLRGNTVCYLYLREALEFLSKILTTYRRKGIEGVVACKAIKIHAGISRQSIRNECNFLRKLAHRNIVGYLGLEEDHVHHEMRIFMEYCERGSLQDFIDSNQRNERIPTAKQVIPIFRQLLDALTYCHYGIKDCKIDLNPTQPQLKSNVSLTRASWQPTLHRDIKPGNVVITVDKIKKSLCYKLCDFGLCRTMEDGIAPSTYVGTKRYTAPEIDRLERIEWTPQCDVYSLGATIYAVLNNGRLPYTYKMTEGIYKQLWSSMKSKLAAMALKEDPSSSSAIDALKLEECVLQALQVNKNTRATTLQLHYYLQDIEKPIPEVNMKSDHQATTKSHHQAPMKTAQTIARFPEQSFKPFKGAIWNRNDRTSLLMREVQKLFNIIKKFTSATNKDVLIKAVCEMQMLYCKTEPKAFRQRMREITKRAIFLCDSPPVLQKRRTVLLANFWLENHFPEDILIRITQIRYGFVFHQQNDVFSGIAPRKSNNFISIHATASGGTNKFMAQNENFCTPSRPIYSKYPY